VSRIPGSGVNHGKSAEPRSSGRNERATKVGNPQERLMELFEQTVNEQNAERFMKLVAEWECYGKQTKNVYQ
jgi:hypothetical protein